MGTALDGELIRARVARNRFFFFFDGDLEKKRRRDFRDLPIRLRSVRARRPEAYLLLGGFPRDHMAQK